MGKYIRLSSLIFADEGKPWLMTKRAWAARNSHYLMDSRQKEPYAYMRWHDRDWDFVSLTWAWWARCRKMSWIFCLYVTGLPNVPRRTARNFLMKRESDTNISRPRSAPGHWGELHMQVTVLGCSLVSLYILCDIQILTFIFLLKSFPLLIDVSSLGLNGWKKVFPFDRWASFW